MQTRSRGKKTSRVTRALRMAARPRVESLESRRLLTAAPINGSTGNVITGVEGISNGGVLLGTFVDGNGAATISDYTSGGGSVVVNWGDGSAPQTLGAFDLNAVGSGASSATWAIDAGHIYSEQGTYAYTVTVDAADGAATIVSGTATIADASLSAQGSQPTLTAATGIARTGPVVSFSDSNPIADFNDLSATIDWGDGSANSTGIVTQPGGVGTAFLVNATHAYANPGSYLAAVTINEVGGSRLVVDNSAIVTDSPLSGSADTITSTEGSSTGDVVLATVDDPNLLATTSGLSAVLTSWGDDTPASPITLPVVLVGGTSSDTVFQIIGSHTYAAPGAYDYSMTVTTTGGQTLDLTGSATVANSALSPNIISAPVVTPIETIGAGSSTGTIPLATFTDASPESVSHYTATIAWGNGNTSNGAITYLNGVFTVDGSNTYATTGDYSPIITIEKDSLTPENVTDADRVVVNVTPHIATDAGLTLRSSDGHIVDAAVADFTSVVSSIPTADFKARIKWGDGSASTVGKVISTGDGTFQVIGGHAYHKNGTYAVTITLSDVYKEKVLINSIADVTGLAARG